MQQLSEHVPRVNRKGQQLSWDIPKFAALHYVPDSIRDIGGTDVTCSGPFEKQHVCIKALLPHTNGQAATLMQQVLHAFAYGSQSM